MKLPPKRRPSPINARSGGSRRWAKLSKQIAKEQPICWLRLPGCTIQSTGADHYYPVATHPHLEFEPQFLRGACHHCNTARRDTPVELLPQLRAKMEKMMKYKPRKALGFFG